MSSLYRTFGGTLRSLNSLTQAGGKRVRCFSTPAAAASSSSGVQDDPSLWVRSVLPDVGLIKGVNTAEYTFENISKWENVTAFVRKYSFHYKINTMLTCYISPKYIFRNAASVDGATRISNFTSSPEISEQLFYNPGSKRGTY